MSVKNIVAVILAFVAVSSCKKYEDRKGDASDPRLNRPYCNDPEAVNYNWDFPGKPDNSTCIYPTDVFKGNYTYYDSIYNGNNELIKLDTFQLNVSATTRLKMTLSGLCPSNAVSFTASRKMRADADSNVANGQLFCRPQDTLSGYIVRNSIHDSLVHFSLSVLSDSGLFRHSGSAIKR